MRALPRCDQHSLLAPQAERVGLPGNHDGAEICRVETLLRWVKGVELGSGGRKAGVSRAGLGQRAF
jgi:hypothetical protein